MLEVVVQLCQETIGDGLAKFRIIWEFGGRLVGRQLLFSTDLGAMYVDQILH